MVAVNLSSMLTLQMLELVVKYYINFRAVVSGLLHTPVGH